MHFNEDFFKWIKNNHYCCVCLNNLLEFQKRLVLKSKTRTLFRFIDSASNKPEFNSISELNVTKSAYIKYSKRIHEIHNNILNFCEKYGFDIVEYEDIAQALEIIEVIIKTYNKQINRTP